MQDNLIKTDDFFKKIMKNYNEQDFESKILLPLKIERESTRKTLQNITGYNEDKVIYRKTLTKQLKRRETEKELLLGLIGSKIIKSPSKLIKEPVLTLGGKNTSTNSSFKIIDEPEPNIRSPKKKVNGVCFNMTESCFIEKNTFGRLIFPYYISVKVVK